MTFKILGTYIRFTPTEYRIIADHLEGAPDVVAEVSGVSLDAVQSIRVHDRTKTKVVLYIPEGAMPALAACIWNGTYLARVRPECSRDAFYRLKQAMWSAVDKISEHGIYCPDMPTC